MTRPPGGLAPPGTAKGKLQRALLGLLARHEAEGALPTSTRFLYYELKQSGYLLARHAARRDDQDVIDAVMAIREAGLVPWEWIADETRDVDAVLTAASVAEWVAEVLDQARLNPWGERPRPVVICESRGVRAALRATARRYAVPVTSTNGQCGGFLRTGVAPLIEAGNPVAYFGDWNPAGSHIEENTRSVLVRAGRWERLAVTPEQAASLGLPPKPGTDRRYRDGRPHESYECEALGQTGLAGLLDAWLAARLPAPIEGVQEREEAERAEVARVLAGLGGGPR
jgi:hypothetical protein